MTRVGKVSWKPVRSFHNSPLNAPPCGRSTDIVPWRDSIPFGDIVPLWDNSYIVPEWGDQLVNRLIRGLDLPLHGLVLLRRLRGRETLVPRWQNVKEHVQQREMTFC